MVERRGTTVTLRRASRLTYGLQPGYSDLVGWQSIEITPDMVGQRVAAFLSIEVKNTNGRLTTRQQLWMRAVRAAGGKADVARSPEEARAILDEYEPDGD